MQQITSFAVLKYIKSSFWRYIKALSKQGAYTTYLSFFK